MDQSPNSSGIKPSTSALDIERLIGDVAQRHDVLLRRDDPILITVTLNERIVERALARLTAVAEASEARTLAASAQQVEAARQLSERLVTAAGEYIASQVRAGAHDAAELTKSMAEKQLTAAQRIAGTIAGAYRSMWWMTVALIAAATLTGAFLAAAPMLSGVPGTSACRQSAAAPKP